jgi:type II secretory pathway component PulF
LKSTGTVAMLASWVIGVPRIRSLAEELGVEFSALTRFVVDHAGVITTVAAVIATIGIAAIGLSRRRRVRIGISIVTSLILFGLVIWDVWPATGRVGALHPPR